MQMSRPDLSGLRLALTALSPHKTQGEAEGHSAAGDSLLTLCNYETQATIMRTQRTVKMRRVSGLLWFVVGEDV